MAITYSTEQLVGATFSKNKTIQEPSQVRPWIRFFARMIDGFLFATVLAISFVYIFPTSAMHYHTLLWMMLPLFLWIPIEALLLSTYGSTPGKWLLKIRIQDTDRNFLSFQASLKRSIHVWERGLAFGFYYAEWVALYFSYLHLKEKGITPWDRSGNCIVTHGKISWKRGIFLSILIVILFALIEYASYLVNDDITRTGLICLLGLPFVISGPILTGRCANAQDKDIDSNVEN